MSKESYFGSALGLIAIICSVVQGMNPLISPIVGWPIVGLLGTLAVVFFIKGIRKKESQKSLILTPHTYAIGLSGMTGYPDEPDNADWLCLEVTVHPSSKPIDTLDLLIGSETIPANDWPGKNVSAFSVYFKVTGWKWKGIIQVELQARIQGAVHSSGRIPIDFNVEYWGSHRI